MRKLVMLLGICATMSANVAHAEIDFSDYDDDLMQTLDKTIKYFEPDITAKNAKNAAGDAEVLLDGFKYTQDYFVKKGGADDAVVLAKRGQEYVVAALKSVSENNYEAATLAARGAAQTCRGCHEVYKTSKR